MLLIPLVLVGVIGPEWGRCCRARANDGIMTAGFHPRSQSCGASWVRGEVCGGLGRDDLMLCLRGVGGSAPGLYFV